MFSIKNRILIVTIFSFFIIIFLIIFTNIYAKNILDSWEDMNQEIRSVERNYTEIDFQIRVLKNILGQIDNYENPISNLIEPYERNQKKLRDVNYKLLLNSQNILYNIDTLNNNPFIHRLVDLNTLEENILDINKKLISIQKNIILLDNINNTANLNLLESIESDYNLINILVTESSEIIDEINNRKNNILFNLLNIMFIVFFIIVISLTILISRILRKDFKYMNTSLKFLNAGIYDINKLPEFKPKYTEELIIKNNTEYIFKEKKFINEIKEIISGEYILDEIVNKLLLMVENEMNTDRIGVAFVDYDKSLIVAEHGAFNYGKVLLGPGFYTKFKDTRLSTLLDTKKSVITNSINNDLDKNPKSRSLQLLKKEGIKSNMIIPLVVNEVVFGFLFFSSTNENNYNENDLKLGSKIAEEISSILNTSYLTKKMFITMISSFSALVEKKDTETGNHIIRMREYSRIITKKLLNHDIDSYKVNEKFLNEIIYYSSAHDIGKVGIPDNILKKPGKLNEEEIKIMQTHTVIGADILIKVNDDLKIFNRDFFNVAIEIAMYHHEKWDGSGYPKGLKEEEIPLSARIIAIADVFDALTSKRVYKPGFSLEKSLAIINDGKGSHFDPVLVDIFNDSIHEVKSIYNNKKLQD